MTSLSRMLFITMLPMFMLVQCWVLYAVTTLMVIGHLHINNNNRRRAWKISQLTNAIYMHTKV